MLHFLLIILYVHGRDGPTIIVEVLDESSKCAVDTIDLGLVLLLEVLLLQLS